MAHRHGFRIASAKVFATVLATLLAALTVPSAAWAQAKPTARLLASRAPHYAGVPVTLEVQAVGFAPEPTPMCSVDDPENGYLSSSGTNHSTRMSISGGRRRTTIEYGFRYQFVSDQPGVYEIGPFTVTQGQRKVTTGVKRLRLREIPISDAMKLRLVLPAKGIYVGQRVPVQVEWWVRSDEWEAIVQSGKRRFSIPLFDLEDDFNFIDREVTRRGQKLSFPIASGELVLAVDVEERRRDGKKWTVVTATRTLVARHEGTWELDAATVFSDRVTRWGREMFGQRRAERAEKIRARDIPRKLVVKPLPRGGKPASFAGAVGRGFTLEVIADRTVVRVGDPIALTLTLRGAGSLETAGLPSLTGGAGLPPAQFRARGGALGGILQDDGSKVFSTSIKVLDNSVREIPGLAYSWFDTERGSYETTHSAPIALSVKQADVVGAESVVMETGDSAGARSGEVGTPSTADRTPRSRVGRVTLEGAELSITRGSSVLASSGGRLGGLPTTVALHMVPLLLLGLAIIGRRHADVDPAVRARRRRVREQVATVEQQRGQPRRAALEAITGALGSLLVEIPAARTSIIDGFIAECETVLFSPTADADAPIDDDLYERARQHARAIAAQVD